MTSKLYSWLSDHADILANTISLVGTTLVTSGLGFVYWWAAAKLFSPAAVGFASAAISSMMLLGVIGVVGLGTLLISELPRLPRAEVGSLLTAALLLTATVSLLLGVGFALGVPYISVSFAPLSHNWLFVLIFAIGVAFTSATTVLDLALIGLLQGQLQFWRNTIFATSKLVLLVGAGLWFVETGITIYGVWLIGNVLSLSLLAFFLTRRRIPVLYKPTWGWLQDFGQVALKHHWLNLATQAPGFIFPILVVGFLSAEANASFYAAWMIVSFIYIVPHHLSTVLHAVGTTSPSVLVSKLRFSLQLSFIASLVGCIFLAVFASEILSLFGPSYGEADRCLQILGLGAVPVVIKAHFITISRLYEFIERAAAYATAGGLLELVLAGTGATIGGLTGIGVGIVVALLIESIFMAPTVFRLLQRRD